MLKAMSSFPPYGRICPQPRADQLQRLPDFTSTCNAAIKCNGTTSDSNGEVCLSILNPFLHVVRELGKLQEYGGGMN